MKESRGITRPSFQSLALAVALAVAPVGRALAADQVDDAVATAGKGWYDKYCTPCHGPGGAPGSAVASANKQPVDLRTYVKRNGGKFPAARWLQVMADVNPGGVHADVWQNIQQDQVGGVDRGIAARGVLGSIARYIVSIQKK